MALIGPGGAYQNTVVYGQLAGSRNVLQDLPDGFDATREPNLSYRVC